MTKNKHAWLKNKHACLKISTRGKPTDLKSEIVPEPLPVVAPFGPPTLQGSVGYGLQLHLWSVSDRNPQQNNLCSPPADISGERVKCISEERVKYVS